MVDGLLEFTDMNDFYVVPLHNFWVFITSFRFPPYPMLRSSDMVVIHVSHGDIMTRTHLSALPGLKIGAIWP